LSEAATRLQVYLAHRRALVEYATPLVGSRAQAEDLVQEAYFRFVRACGQPDIRQPASYLYRIVRNLAVDLMRSLAAEGRRNLAYAETIEPDLLSPSPEEALLHRKELDEVAAALAELPDEKRLAFEMSRLGGVPFHEIARHLGVSTASANRMAQDALLHVMRRLNRAKG